MRARGFGQRSDREQDCTHKVLACHSTESRELLVIAPSGLLPADDIHTWWRKDPDVPKTHWPAFVYKVWRSVVR
ncbi:MAG TPA: hypothetical protein VGG85_00310, partial [Terracidiphilus sp.]